MRAMPTITIADPATPLADASFNTLLEIVENFEDPFELVREFLSNSSDSNATNVTIEFLRGSDHLLTFIYEDDGEGLRTYTDTDGNCHNRLEYFFLLGKSDKRSNPNKIGKKGFGSKICFLSDSVKVSSRYITDDDKTANVTADLDNPYTKLRDKKLVEAVVTIGPCDVKSSYKTGTRIEIRNFHATNEDKFSKLPVLNEYIHWFTAGGTVLPLVRSGSPSMQITLKDWNGTHTFSGEHNPPQDTDPTTLPVSAFTQKDKKSVDGMEVILRSNQYAMRVVFPNPCIQITHEGKLCSIEVAAWILGSSKKDEFASLLGPDRDLFGVWLAQGGILVKRHYSWVTSSPLDCNFHVIVNCDQFELNADRTSIKGNNNKLYVRVKAEFDENFKPAILEAHKAFRRLKSVEDTEIEELEIQKANRDRVNEITDRTEWTSKIAIIGLEREPKTELEACGALCALLANHPDKFPFKVHDLSPRGTDAVVSIEDRSTRLLRYTMYEVEMTLANFLKHGHSPDSANGIICWQNDMPERRRPKTLKGVTASFNPDSRMLEIFASKVTLANIRNGATPKNCIPVYVLADICTELEDAAALLATSAGS